MTYINFITGLIIAAVLSVPGTMQHEATTVEEEPMVKGVNRSGEALQLTWYVLTPGGTPTNPADYSEATGGEENLCSIGQHICAINAFPNGTQPRLDEVEDADLLAMIKAADGASGTPDPNVIKKRSQP